MGKADIGMGIIFRSELAFHFISFQYRQDEND